MSGFIVRILLLLSAWTAWCPNTGECTTPSGNTMTEKWPPIKINCQERRRKEEGEEGETWKWVHSNPGALCDSSFFSLWACRTLFAGSWAPRSGRWRTPQIPTSTWWRRRTDNVCWSPSTARGSRNVRLTIRNFKISEIGVVENPEPAVFQWKKNVEIEAKVLANVQSIFLPRLIQPYEVIDFERDGRKEKRDEETAK